MSNKKADYILDRDLKKEGYTPDRFKSGVYYKGNDEIHTDRLSYNHKDKPLTAHQHTNGKKIK